MKNCEVIRGIGESPIQTATQLNNCFFSKIRKEKGEVMRRIGENQMQKKKKNSRRSSPIACTINSI